MVGEGAHPSDETLPVPRASEEYVQLGKLATFHQQQAATAANDVTPDEMYTLTKDALAHREHLRPQLGVERTDAIEAALNQEDREGIENITW